MQAQLTHEEMGLNIVGLDYIRAESLHDCAQLGHGLRVEATTFLYYKRLKTGVLSGRDERIRQVLAPLECDDGQFSTRESLVGLAGAGGELDEVLRGTADRLRLD